MSAKNQLPDEQVSCEVCLKEVPASEAKNAETDDYVAHFCGLACFEQWQKKKVASETDQK